MTEVTKIKMGKADVLRNALNKLIGKWGLMLSGVTRLKALKLIGKFNNELAGFDKLNQELFEKFGIDETKTIPASEHEGVITPERKEPTGNKIIPKEKMAEFTAEKEPLANSNTDLNEAEIFNFFSAEEMGSLVPSDQQELLEQSACLYELTDLIRLE